MCTRSLIPRSNTTVIGLGARLVHTGKHELTSTQLAWSLPVVVTKAYATYAHQLGKALHSAAYLYVATLKTIEYSQL